MKNKPITEMIARSDSVITCMNEATAAARCFVSQALPQLRLKGAEWDIFATGVVDALRNFGPVSQADIDIVFRGFGV